MSEPSIDTHWETPIRSLPALRLLQGIGLALDARKLVLALLGVLLMWGGWTLLEGIFPESPRTTSLTTRNLRLGPVRIGWEPIAQAGRLVTDPIRLPLEPARAVFAMGGGNERFLHGLLATLWAGFVWTLIGAAIARWAVLEVTTGRRHGVLTGLTFAARKATSLLAAPAIPLIGVLFFVGLASLFGLLYRPAAPAFGIIAGVLAFLPLLLGIVLLWLLIGLAAGWPLMVASVAAESEDSFDALSRAFSYVFQRPVLLGTLAAVAWAVGTGGVLLVVLLTRLLLHLTAWSVAFGAPDATVSALFGPLAANPKSTVEALHADWIALVTLLAYSWVFAYVWSAAAQIYLLVRLDVDGTPFDSIAVESSPATAPVQPASDPDPVPMPSADPSGDS